MYSQLYITIHYCHAGVQSMYVYINQLMYSWLYSYTAMQCYTSKMMYHHPSGHTMVQYTWPRQRADERAQQQSPERLESTCMAPCTIHLDSKFLDSR